MLLLNGCQRAAYAYVMVTMLISMTIEQALITAEINEYGTWLTANPPFHPGGCINNRAPGTGMLLPVCFGVTD